VKKSVRMNPHLHRTPGGIVQWTPFARALKAAETTYQALGWQAPRRLVVVRETIREGPEARGRKLLEIPGYTLQSPPSGMTRWKPGASTRAAPNVKTASRSSKKTLAPMASACTPSTAPKPRRRRPPTAPAPGSALALAPTLAALLARIAGP
jgi:hypothetical protein